MESNKKPSFKIAQLPGPEDAFVNAVFVNPVDFETVKSSNKAKERVYIKIKSTIMELKEHSSVTKGCLAMGKLCREMTGISSTGNIDIECKIKILIYYF
jgi:hypothetical protein